MKRLLFGILLVTGLCIRAGAQDFKPIAWEEYTLKNGLTVILHVDRTAPTAMTYLLYRVGSKDEVPGRTGFAHFFEHLMFEGSAHIGRGQIDKMVTAAGGMLNASTSFDQTEYFFKVPINQLQLALWIESDRMMSLVIDSLGIETQRKVVKEELKQRYEGRPYGKLFENVFKLTFKNTPYEWMPIGNPADINSATKEEFIDFHSKYYIPNNACLVVAGDLDIPQAKKWIQEYFEPIAAGPAPQRVPITIPPQTEPRSETITESITPLPALIESYATVDNRHPDAYALEMLADVMSTGESSRLYQRLVNKEQLAMTAANIAFSMDKAGLFAFYVIGNRGVSLETLKKVVAEELARVQKDGITEEEFQKVRNQKETDFVKGFASIDMRVRKLAYYSLFQNNTALVNDEFKKYLAVTRDDIKRVANTYLDPKRVNTIEYVVMDAK